MKTISTGIENFKKLIDNDYYYVDKTQLINDVLKEEVVLYTRPRRFGKTLNMSMLYYFFSNKEKENAYLFDGLQISKNTEAMKHQNQYPTIFITLKNMKDNNYHGQLIKFRDIISLCTKKHLELLDSPYLLESEKYMCKQYVDGTVELDSLDNALFNLTYYLEKHYHQKVIVLIDEYDVPLQSAYLNHYYDEMSNFISNVFSSALKTNDALEKGIMTGCLRIAKESIFTGLNNFKVRSIFDISSANYFGFNQNEIDILLDYYNLSSYKEKLKEWYDGYLFGKTEIYNPWSTLMYLNKIIEGDEVPESFWANTSGNDIVKNYIVKGTPEMKDEFDTLASGKAIIKEIKPELTYREMDSIDNIYSFLLYTGYLKAVNKIKMNTYELVIPNHEIYIIYKQIFKEYFKDYTKPRKTELYQALLNEEVEKAYDLLNDILENSISYFDNYENFYHGFLVGLFSDEIVESNKEAGDGRFDVRILPRRITGKAIVIECKHSISELELIKDAKEGANQIVEKGYLKVDGNVRYQSISGYGISFNKKQCYLVLAK